MNNRKRNRAAARRKADLSKRQALHRLLDVALDVNGVDARQQKTTGYLPTVFFEYYGHIGKTCIRVHENGWYPNSHADYDEFVGFDDINKTIKELSRYEQP